MRKIIIYIEKIILRFFVKILSIKKERILFTSFNGHYSDSPKYISEKIHEKNKNIEIVWLVEEKYKNNLPEYIKAIDISNKFACAYYRGTSCAIIDNTDMGMYLRSDKKIKKLYYKLLVFIYKKKNQKYYTTWHGTPLKRMGKDTIGSTIVDYIDCADTTMLFGNRFTLDIMKRLTFNKNKTVLIGTPRNDILFAGEKNNEELKRKLGISEDKKIILFAPTFRSDIGEFEKKNVLRSGINQLKEINFTELFKTLSRKFGGEWCAICRFHYFVEKMIDWRSLEKEYPNQIINGNRNDDMAEYLACADALITDASSSMFDFMLTKKPCFLFFPDLEHYRSVERGFYVPIEELPFSIAENSNELIENIKAFDKQCYVEEVRKLISKFEYVDDADSSERIAQYILDEMKYND